MQKSVKLLFRRILAVVLLFCLAVPASVEPPKRAEAATDSNVITMEKSNGYIKKFGKVLTHYNYAPDTGLVLSNTYHYVANIVDTYQTINTIWSKKETGVNGIPYGHPMETGTEGKDWVYSGVAAVDKESDAATHESTSTYTYTQDNIIRMLTALFGELEPGKAYTVYISEVFQLKKRHYLPDGRIDFSTLDVYGPSLYTLEDIQNAPQNYGNPKFHWSTNTYNGFRSYYDIPMTFIVSGGNLNVVCVDMDNYNMELTRESEQLVVGKQKNVKAQSSLSYNGEEYIFQGKYNISKNETCTLDKTGGIAQIKMGAGENITVYFGYRKKPVEKKVNLNIICVDKDNTSVVLSTMKTQAILGKVCNVVVNDTLTRGGTKYMFANVYGVSDIGLCTLDQTGKPGGVQVDRENMTLYLGYQKQGAGVTPPPSLTPLPTPTPAPSATPTPVLPSGEVDHIYERYYTTSEGHTLDAIMGQDDSRYNGYLVANAYPGGTEGKPMKTHDSFERKASYSMGSEPGKPLNKWLFLKDTENGELVAREVHPYQYEFNYMLGEDVKKVKKIVFPEYIEAGGKQYKVVSIGGGDYDTHKEEKNVFSNPYYDETTGASTSEQRISDYGRIEGSYFFNYSFYNPVSNVNTFFFRNQTYWFGCVGNGMIETEAQYNNYNTSYMDRRWYNYYVYNTTLEEITIPDTVTEILPHAFQYCQALKKINGGKNVEIIGAYAFEGVPTVAGAITEDNTKNPVAYSNLYKYMNTQKSWSYKDYGIECEYSYFYNESKRTGDTDTEVMKKWRQQIQLSDTFAFPQPEQVPKLCTLGELAFAYHTNLKDVVLSEQVENVGKECFGYDKLVQIELKNPDTTISQHYQTLGTHGFYTPTDERTLVIAGPVSTAANYVTRYTNWYKMNGKKEIELDGWEPDIHTDTVVEVEDGEKSRNVTPPIKDLYYFEGYYTEPNGGGKKYFDEDGTCIKEWEEPDTVKKLYANWEPGDPPEYEPYIPEVDPLEPGIFEVLIKRDGTKVQIYADDCDATTGALTDKQPYFADDVKDGAVVVAEGAIPSTEKVSMRGRTSAYMYYIKLKENTGVTNSRITVTVPYSITYQDETGVKQTKKGSYQYDFDVPNATSYWQVEKAVVLKPESVLVSNSALKDGMVTIPVSWSGVSTPDVPLPVVTHSASSSVSGTTMESVITYEDTYKAESDIDWDKIKGQCKNIASQYQTEANTPVVKNDKLVIDGKVILDNTPSNTGIASGPDGGVVAELRNGIPLTEYEQTYQSGIELKQAAGNGTYESLLRVTYKGDDGSEKYVQSGEPEVTINKIKIHTPVVCDGIFGADGTETGRYADGDFGYGDDAELTLHGIFNPFTVEVSNYGLHRMLLGYGERDFVVTKSGIGNIDVKENAVKFPFGVYYDKDADSFKADGSVDFTGDGYFPANTWIKIGDSKPQFYVLGSIEPGRYAVEFRSVAVNCPTDESGAYLYNLTHSANNANLNVDKYIARDLIYLNIREDFIDFRLNGTNDPSALKDFNSGRRMLTLDKGYYFNFYTQTIGKAFNSQTMEVDITPTYTFISEDGKIRTAADVYYNENVKGKSEFFVKVGNVKDRNNIHTYTNRDELVGVPVDILRNTVEVSADSQFAGKKRDLFAFGGTISSDYVLRMYPKLNTKLPNKYCSGCYVTYCSQDGRPCSCTDTQKTIFNLSSNEVKSMVQAWYGGLYIPADSFVITKDTKQGMCPMCGKLRYVTDGRTVCPDHKVALTDLAGFDFNTYAANNTVSGNEEFFRKDGYIAVNFQIKAVDGSYERVYADYDETEIAEQWKKSKVPYRSGDIILYRLDKSIRNAYEIGGSE